MFINWILLFEYAVVGFAVSFTILTTFLITRWITLHHYIKNHLDYICMIEIEMRDKEIVDLTDENKILHRDNQQLRAEAKAAKHVLDGLK